MKIKLQHKNKIFIYRIDGPIRLYNNMNDKRDIVVNIVNRLIADGTIFQSNWSREENYKLGLLKRSFETIIYNVPNTEIFNKSGGKKFLKNKKVNLIASSWSVNWKKGFKVYKWLDENLDFNKYNMVFIGNSPVKFKNIRHIFALTSKELAKELKKSDIFIFASKIEACSNSLLEALYCGFPSIAYCYSSNPEIIGKGGEYFNELSEIPFLIEKIVNHYYDYQLKINIQQLNKVCGMYYDFILNIYKKVKNSEYLPKQLSYINYITIMKTLIQWKFNEVFVDIKAKIGC